MPVLSFLEVMDPPFQDTGRCLWAADRASHWVGVEVGRLGFSGSKVFGLCYTHGFLMSIQWPGVFTRKDVDSLSYLSIGGMLERKRLAAVVLPQVEERPTVLPSYIEPVGFGNPNRPSVRLPG